MPNLIERAFASVGFVRQPLTQPSYGRGPYARLKVQMAVQGYDPRRGAKMLRHWSRTNEWIRRAIEYRCDQICKASWKIVRTDDPKKPPVPAVENAVRDLFKIVNPKRQSLRWLLSEVVEDILVLDAGCIEKEKTLGGSIEWLWSVDGATIVPDPSWDGSDINAPRYFQIINGQEKAALRNDQLIYMMHTPTTYSPLGWSPVETLMRTIEADLFGEQYDYEMLKQTAPAGLLSLGAGVTPDQVASFREFYNEEIAGSHDIVIFGGGTGDEAGKVSWTPFGRSNREQERQVYKEWLVKKIATVFAIDKSIFNITESVNRATSKTQQQRTDEGLESLADLVAEFITREIVWEFDENHGFAFDNLSDRDLAQEAEIDCAYVGSGIWTINEIRAKQGLDKVEWGDSPYSVMNGPLSPEVPPSAQDQMDNANANAQADRESGVNKDDDDKNDKVGKNGGSKTIAPFVLTAQREAARMRQQRLDYLNACEASSTTNVNV